MLTSLLQKIEHNQNVLDELKYPILNPISYYKSDQEYRDNIENDTMNYKNYERALQKNIIFLECRCEDEGIKIHNSNKKTINLKIKYIDIEKQKAEVDELSDYFLENFKKFKI